MKKVVSTLFFVFIIQIVHAQLASGTYAIGPSSSYSGYTTKYSTITAAVTAMSSGISGAVIFELQSDYVSTTETFPITIGQISGTSSSNTITIRPASGVTSQTISGSSTSQIFNLNGVDYLTIDGRPGGTGTTKQLTIANTSTSGTVFTFSADATYNTLTYLTIQGVNNSATSGNIVFGTGTSTGNTNNTINYCVLKDGATTPANIIYSVGGSTTSLKNSSILIDNNEIANFFLNAGTSCGILVGDYNDSWTISNNSFYQSSGRFPSSGTTLVYCINVVETQVSTNFTISGNYIGGSSASCVGTWTQTPATINHTFNAIRLSGATGATIFSVQGNTIKNINIGNSNSGSGTGAIFLLKGAANIGTTSGNTIGDMSTTGSFVYSNFSTGTMNAISIGSGTNTIGNVNIQNNQIGGITASGGANSIRGIVLSGSAQTAGTNCVISGNTIGGTVANSIQNSGTGVTLGIWNANTGTVWTPTISGNIIRNLACTNTGTASYSVRGIAIAGAAVTNTISGNRIYNLSNSGTGTSTLSIISGIQSTVGTSTIVNNQIAITQSTNQPYIYGIELPTTTNNVFYNSIYIGGTAASAVSSYGIFRTTIGAHNLQNNFVYNERSGNSSTNFAIGFGTAGAFGTINNNVYVTADATTVGSNAGTSNDLPTWRTTTGGETLSFSYTSSTEPSTIFNALSTGDLSIPSATNHAIVAGRGVYISTVLTDYAGKVRSTTNPTVGSIEYSGSSDATLSALATSAGTLSPTFLSGTTSYTASVSNATTSITVTPTVNQANATVTVNGTTVASGTASGSITLNVGTNTITTIVTAQDGTIQTYTITVTRAGSSDATLSGLAISTGTLSPTFSSGTTTYTASVSNAISSITVTPTANYVNATVKVNGTAVTSGTASGSISLNPGANTITTVVTAQDGITTQTYTVTVTRAGSSDATLSGLALSSGTLSPTFASGTISYTASVSNTTTSITVKPTVNQANATVTVNGTTVSSGSASGSIALNVGTNTIITAVTAQDGTTTNTYTITVTRAGSSDATLAGLAISIGTLSPTFASGTTSYTASVSNATTSITLTPTVNQANATVKVNGTTVTSGSASGSINLNVGTNIITTIVTAQDGTTTQTYTTTVTRAASSDATLSTLALSSGTLSPTFASGTTSYTASVSSTTTSITVTPTVNQANATVKVNGTTVSSGSASGSISLNFGANIITTVVTAQDGTTTNTYTLTVTRATSNNASLSNLVLSAGTLTPAFASGTTSYVTGISIGVASITVTPTVSDPTATVKVNGTTVTSGTASGSITMNTGSNTVTVVVTAQDGTTTNTYTIIVTKSSSSSVSTLNNLVLSSGTLNPTFASGITSYTASVSNATTSITVTPTVTDATATVTVNGVAVTSGSASGVIALSVGANTITTAATAQNGINVSTYTTIVTRAGSSDATLAGLAVSTGTLSPTFAPGTTSYTVSVSNATTSITLTPTVNQANATVKVNGTTVASGSASGSISLNAGANTITTVVTAQDGTTTQTYITTVTRATSNDATLSALALNSGTLSPTFASGTTSYTASVSNATTSVTITPTVNQANATVKVNGTVVSSGSASGSISLNFGANTITTVVTAQDGSTTQTYTITVTRAAPSSNNNLSNLVISSGILSPSFASATNSYTATVNGATSSITVTPTTADVTATVAVNGTAVTSGSASGSISLSLGSNTITIIVTAQNGATNTYTLSVTRQYTPQTITFNTLTPVTYGAADFAPGAASTNTSIAITYASSNTAVATITSGGLIHVVGAGSTNITASQSGDATYAAATPVVQALTVNKANLNITASNATKVYGAANPTLGVTYTGFVNTDANTSLTAQPTITTTAVTGSAVGTYPITAGGATSNNYSISYTAGTLTVTQASLTITANNQTRTTNTANPTLTATYTGFVNGDTNSSLTTQPTLATTATLTSPPGNYPITVTGASSANYSISYVAGTLTIIASANANLANLTISSGTLSPVFAQATTSYTASVANTVTSVTITPTSADPTATIKVNGVSVISGSASQSIPLTAGSNTITTTVTAQNGTTVITYTTKVTRAPSTDASLANLTISNGTLSPAFTPSGYVYTILVDNTVSQFTLTPTLTDATATILINGQPATNAVQSSPINLVVGDNAITVSTTAQDGITNLTYTLTVHRAIAPAAIKPNNILSPNGDGKNDTWVVKDIQSYPNNKVTVFDRAGRIVYTQKSYNNDWNGTLHGSPLSEGTYYYVIDLGTGDDPIKGFITMLLLR